MKKYFYILFLLASHNIYGQITSPAIRANFGVDADLRANFFNQVDTNNGDDWFNYNNSQTGVATIDTTGAAAIVSRYATDPGFRLSSFSRGMAFPSFSTVNNKLLIDAVFVRDYHADDSTSYGPGSKNGVSPGDWTSPPSQPIPNKNDILDVMAHVRRDGPGNTDSLWMFGGVSIEGTSGDRYFDFEMYQTDIYFDATTRKFYNYGPDAGHTSWKFDSAGNAIQAGDIIFSADYDNSTLSTIEARIWIDKSSLLITPVGFDWNGSFDGASNGSQYGYAGIKPKTAGNFYTGMENTDSTWAGPFSLIREDNSVVTGYAPGQFMELSVNLTKLGLDPATMIGNYNCLMPYKRIMVKSRASTSFTAQLKDFVGPIDFFQSSRANATSDLSLYCGLMGPVTIEVTNPVPNSVYTWSTTDGSIVSDPVNDSIIVDAAGTYVVSQQLQPGCTIYATDTVVVPPFNKICAVLETGLTGFTGRMVNKNVQLNWSVTENKKIKYFEIEHSSDCIHFITSAKVNSYSSDLPIVKYGFNEENKDTKSTMIYYRLKIVNVENKISYSKILPFSINGISANEIKIFPNPVKDVMQLDIFSFSKREAAISIYNAAGLLMKTVKTNVEKGNSQLNFFGLEGWPDGVYFVKVEIDNDLMVKKMILRK